MSPPKSKQQTWRKQSSEIKTAYQKDQHQIFLKFASRGTRRLTLKLALGHLITIQFKHVKQRLFYRL